MAFSKEKGEQTETGSLSDVIWKLLAAHRHRHVQEPKPMLIHKTCAWTHPCKIPWALMGEETSATWCVAVPP